MPDPKNEAFLQREAEREKQRRRENRHAWLKLGKQTIQFLFVAGCAGIVIYFFAYTLICINNFQQNRCTKTLICDNSHLPQMRYNYEWLMYYFESDYYSNDDKEKVSDACEYLRDYNEFSSVTITEKPGIFWDPNSEITDMSYEFTLDQDEQNTQFGLCIMSLYWNNPEIYTVAEFNEIVNAYQGTDFSEVTSNPDYKWFCDYARNDYMSYSNIIENIWSSYCDRNGHKEYENIREQWITTEDLVKIAQYENGNKDISIDFRKYFVYMIEVNRPS